MEILFVLGLGVLAGMFLQRNTKLKKRINQAMSLMICLLLFFLGISVGNNPDIVQNIHLIGGDAFVLGIGAMAGSLACSYFVYVKYFKKGKQARIS